MKVARPLGVRLTSFLLGVLVGLMSGIMVGYKLNKEPAMIEIQRVKLKDNKEVTSTLLDCCEALKQEKKRQRKEKRKSE